MVKTKKQKILAIDHGTKNIGFAIFECGELTYYGVKSIPKNKSPRIILKNGMGIIQKLIEDFHPKILVIEKSLFLNNKPSALVNEFYNQILKIGKKNKLEIHSFATNTVRKQICGDGKASKEDIAKLLILLYPQLKPYFSNNRKWDVQFHLNMFDAIALGLMINRI